MQNIMGVPIEGLIVLGLMLKIAGFAFRDELWLRTLVATGMLADLLYYALRADPILESAFANGVMVAINMTLIVFILQERTTLRMSPEQITLYKAFPTLSPGHFRKLYGAVTWQRTTQAKVLLEAGGPVTQLYYVFAEHYTISKGGQPFTARGPAFVGEIALLTGNPSSATVELPPGAGYVEIPTDVIRRQMARSRSFHNSMVALFATDLAVKVANSSPLDTFDAACNGAGEHRAPALSKQVDAG